MEIDWHSVKQQTLWSYEDLVKKLLTTLAYAFVQEYYNHSMTEAQRYARQVGQGYLQGQSDPARIDQMIANFKTLESLEIGTYLALIQQVETREQCVVFLQRTDFDFDQVIQTLNYLLRWVLPFKTPVREYVEVDDEVQIEYLKILKKHKLSSNLDILEAGRTQAGRVQLSETTGIPETFILGLVHRADISRLAYVRGKTVRHLCGGGYDTLEKIARAELKTMETEMEAYYRTIGKSLADFKSVIPLAWMRGGAMILPRVVEG